MRDEPVKLHLSAQELCGCFADGPNQKQAASLKVCERCAADLRRGEMVGGGARRTVSKWAESLQTSETAFLKRLMERHRRRQELRFAQLATAVLLLLLVPAGVMERQHREQIRRQADEVLLQQVDEEIAEKVPTAMQPLTRLVAWQDDVGLATGATHQEETIRKGTK